MAKAISRKKVSRQDVQSQLAKIAAGENISVIYGDCETPYFNLKTRELNLPYWVDNISDELFNLLTFHEIGHALETPPEGWHHSIRKCVQDHEHDDACYDSHFQGFLNVCEDARQEKITKRRYPGTRRDFSIGYMELYERDYFGVKGIDPDLLSLIDRINLYTKIGAHLHIDFDAHERTFVDRLEACETFDEAEKIARDIYAEQKNQPQQIKNMMDIMSAKAGEMKKQQPKDQKDQDKKDSKDSSDCQDGKSDGKGDQQSDKREGKGQGKSKKDKDQDTTKSGKGKSKGDKSEEKDEEKGSGKQDKSDSEKDQDEGDDESDGSGSDENDGDTDSDSSKGEDKGNEDGDSDEGDSDGDSDGEEGDESDSDQERHGGDRGGHDKNGRGSEKGSNKMPVNSPVCITDEIFRQKEKNLNSHLSVVNVTLPFTNLDRIIYPVKDVVDFFEHQHQPYDPAYDAHSAAVLTHVLSRHNSHINTLIKEFEMRKNAKDYYRQMTHRSGEIDTRRLSQYRITSDIFRRVTEVPKGKSHGMIFILDMSSSMDGQYMFYAIEQILILSVFCKKVKIPFDVYGFADRNAYPDIKINDKRITSGNPKDLQLKLRGGFHLRHLLSSECAPTLYNRAMRMLAYYMGKHTPSVKMSPITRDVFKTNVVSTYDAGLPTSGTPLSETTAVSRQIIEEFRARTRVDITNVIYLTDGEGNAVSLPYDGVSYDVRQRLAKVIITDPRSKEFIIADKTGLNVQEALIKLVKKISGCRHIGYYICDDMTVRNKFNEMETGTPERAAADKTLREYGYIAIPTAGFDCYYYITPNMLTTPDTVDATSSDEMVKQAKRKKAAHMILSQFAQQIGTTEGLEDRL